MRCKLGVVFIGSMMLSACMDIPAYRGPNAPADEVAFGIPVSETTYPASLDSGNLALRYDLTLSKEVFYQGAEKNPDSALREFRIDRKSSQSLQNVQFQGAYPANVADYRYNYAEPALTGLWQFDAEACELVLKAKSGAPLLRLKGARGEQTVSYKQGGVQREKVMIYQIAGRSEHSALNNPQLDELWQRGHFYSRSEFVRCKD